MMFGVGARKTVCEDACIITLTPLSRLLLYPLESDEVGDKGGVEKSPFCVGVWMESGRFLSNELRLTPRCVISFVPSVMSTPGIDAKMRETSLAACVNPARKRSSLMTGLAWAKRCWRRNLCKCRTVNSRMSAVRIEEKIYEFFVAIFLIFFKINFWNFFE